MKGAADLLRSERGVFCCFALVAVTVLASLRIIASDEWLSFVRYMLGVLVASKTVTTAVEVWRTKAPQNQEAAEIPRAEIVEER